MPATDLSPNTDNYYMGQGIVYFRPVDQYRIDDPANPGTEIPGPWRDVGNVPRFEFSTNVTKQDHFSSRTAIRSKDKSVVTQQEASIGITMEELTGPNLAMFLLGIQTGSDAEAVIEIGRRSDIRGDLLFVGTNEIGPKWNFYFDQVGFSPDGALNTISGGDWGSFQLTAEIFMRTVNETDRFGLAARAIADIPEAANLTAA